MNVTDLSPVESSNIAAIGFELGDPEYATGEMYVQFKTGGVFRFDAVPQEKYEAFLSAKSKGNFFATQVRKKYGGARMMITVDVDEHGVAIQKFVEAPSIKTAQEAGIYAQQQHDQRSAIRTGSIDL